MSENSRTKLIDGDELLLRQAHPSFVQGEHLSAQVFEPTKRDVGKLSVDRDSLATPAQSYHLYTTGFGLKSTGVYGVSVAEALAEELGAYPDPIEPEEGRPGNPAHAYLDFTPLEPPTRRKAAQRLRDKAVRRGKLWPR